MKSQIKILYYLKNNKTLLLLYVLWATVNNTEIKIRQRGERLKATLGTPQQELIGRFKVVTPIKAKQDQHRLPNAEFPQNHVLRLRKKIHFLKDY